MFFSVSKGIKVICIHFIYYHDFVAEGFAITIIILSRLFLLHIKIPFIV